MTVLITEKRLLVLSFLTTFCFQNSHAFVPSSLLQNSCRSFQENCNDLTVSIAPKPFLRDLYPSPSLVALIISPLRSSRTTLSSLPPASTVTDEDGPTPVQQPPTPEVVNESEISQLQYIRSDVPIPSQEWRRGLTNGCEDPIDAEWRNEANDIIFNAVRKVGGVCLDVTWHVTFVTVTIDERNLVNVLPGIDDAVSTEVRVERSGVPRYDGEYDQERNFRRKPRRETDGSEGVGMGGYEEQLEWYRRIDETFDDDYEAEGEEAAAGVISPEEREALTGRPSFKSGKRKLAGAYKLKEGVIRPDENEEVGEGFNPLLGEGGSGTLDPDYFYGGVADLDEEELEAYLAEEWGVEQVAFEDFETGALGSAGKSFADGYFSTAAGSDNAAGIKEELSAHNSGAKKRGRRGKDDPTGRIAEFDRRDALRMDVWTFGRRLVQLNVDMGWNLSPAALERKASPLRERYLKDADLLKYYPEEHACMPTRITREEIVSSMDSNDSSDPDHNLPDTRMTGRADGVDTVRLAVIANAIIEALSDDEVEERLQVLTRHEVILTADGISGNPSNLETQSEFDRHHGRDVIVQTVDPFGSNRVLKGKLIDRNALDVIVEKAEQMVTIPQSMISYVRAERYVDDDDIVDEEEVSNDNFIGNNAGEIEDDDEGLFQEVMKELIDSQINDEDNSQHDGNDDSDDGLEEEEV